MYLRIAETGNRRWFNAKGQLHREDGPAVELIDGGKYWYINGNLHREDGPAIEYSNGTKYWYFKGRSYTEEQYVEKVKGEMI